MRLQTLAAHEQLHTKTKPMSQLQGIEQKEVIKRVTGKIVKLWEPKTFKGPKGEFEIQGGAIEIDGQEYGLKFFENNQNASILEGKVVTISCSRGKHGFTGVTLDHESFSKKDGTKVDRDVIKVTKTGKVELGEGTEELPVAKAATPVSHGSQDSAKSLDDLVMQHLYINDLVRAAYSSKGYDEETLRSYVSSVYIEANRKGLSAPSSAPKEEPVDPSDWGSFIVPSGSMNGKKLAAVGKPHITKLYQHFLEKGFTTDFAKAVEQAAKDLNLDGPVEDDLPMEDQPDIPW
jgi:hypothetical protein